ncbi:MAG: hypothetical protein L6Q37_00215 [Bdellovibrionaceae bacterium]|nr:hypothetical protein [Pseudobdellovibrionaceae bacterium]NUM58963.1 hypothetical protein [Pseudobdellovibrionaceae bacterium]
MSKKIKLFILILAFTSCSKKNVDTNSEEITAIPVTVESQKENPLVEPDKNGYQKLDIAPIHNNSNSTSKEKKIAVFAVPKLKESAQPNTEESIIPIVSNEKTTLHINEENSNKDLQPTPTVQELKAVAGITPCENDTLFSIHFFGGFNYFLFNQTANIETENGNFSQQTLSQVGFAIDLNVNNKTNIEFTHRQIQASIPTQGETSLDQNSTKRTVTTFDISYLLKKMIYSSYSVIVGLKNALIPALSTDINNSIVNVYSHELSSISIGMKYNYQLKSDSEIFAKAQVLKLIEGKSQNKLLLNISDTSQFGISFGVNRKITKNTAVGFEIEHNQSQFPYSYTRNGIDSKGRFNLQDTSVLLKIGFNF